MSEPSYPPRSPQGRHHHNPPPPPPQHGYGPGQPPQHTSPTDFGEFMVRYGHAGVYQGEHDAPDEYVKRLYSKDTELALNPRAGRNCEDPYSSSSSDGSVAIDDDDDHNSHDGSIIPACARKWWC